MSTDAGKRQVGGDHYKQMAIQPWDFLKACLSREEYIGWAKGVITIYHARARLKGGDQDLLKAHHHSEDLAEYLKAHPDPKGGQEDEIELATFEGKVTGQSGFGRELAVMVTTPLKGCPAFFIGDRVRVTFLSAENEGSDL